MGADETTVPWFVQKWAEVTTEKPEWSLEDLHGNSDAADLARRCLAWLAELGASVPAPPPPPPKPCPQCEHKGYAECVCPDDEGVIDATLLDAIDTWHESDDVDIPLHEYLGMTWEGYKQWVQVVTGNQRKHHEAEAARPHLHPPADAPASTDERIPGFRGSGPWPDMTRFQAKQPVLAVQMRKPFVVSDERGDMQGQEGDFLVMGLHGERYPLKKEVFLESYARAQDDPLKPLRERLMADLREGSDLRKRLAKGDDVRGMANYAVHELVAGKLAHDAVKKQREVFTELLHAAREVEGELKDRLLETLRPSVQRLVKAVRDLSWLDR